MIRPRLWPLLLVLLCTVAAWSQRCTEGKDMDPTTRSAIDSAARQYFQMAANADSAGLQQNSILSVAQNFGGISNAVRDNLAGLQGSQPNVRSVFLLDASNATGTVQRAEFYCGVFGAYGHTATSSAFFIPNLPAGMYALAIVDAQGSKEPFTLSFVLQQMGQQWKLAGYYAKAGTAATHNGDWYVQQARDYKQKGDNATAYFYYWQARDLLAPVPFMSTLQLDKLYDEMQQVAPKDLPVGQNQTVNFNANGKTYPLMTMFPLPVGNELDLVVKYASPDISDTAKTWQENMDLINALMAKYPAFRNAFQAIVARAVAPGGQDYGTVQPTKQTPNSPQSATK
ncbi:MAG: hypothetical protein ROO76_00775 [Terriglobia bacterium]|nr:hypothetical protein [Terriglobia bacterium]